MVMQSKRTMYEKVLKRFRLNAVVFIPFGTIQLSFSIVHVCEWYINVKRQEHSTAVYLDLHVKTHQHEMEHVGLWLILDT